MPILLSRTSEATVDDSLPYQTPLAVTVRRTAAPRLAILAAASFVVALIATLPARLVLPRSATAGPIAVGTVWNGEIAVGDQTAVSWRFSPWRSLLRLGVAADVVVRGGVSDMKAQAVWRPGRLELTGVSGIAGPGLVNTLIAELPIQCDLSFAVDLDRVVIAGPRSNLAGAVHSGPGTCTAENGLDTAPAVIPAMVGQAITGPGGTSAWLAPAAQPQGFRLVAVTIDRTGRLKATVLPAGALILPAAAGQMSIETQL